MKRRYFILFGLFLASSIAAGSFSAVIAKPKPIKPFQPKTKDEKAIVALVDEDNKTRKPPIIISRLVLVEQYGLYAWVLGSESGGQTLVKRDDSGSWQIVRGTGGMLDADLLTRKFKVPTDVAKQLIQKMNAQIKADKS